MHQIRLNIKAGLAGPGTADYQHIFVDVVLGILVPPHHDALGLRQQNVLRKVRVDEGLDVLRRAP